MQNVTVEYLKQDPRNGRWLYRRVVPKALKPWVQQREFVKTLGKTRQEALIQYGPYHQRIEHMKSLAQAGVAGLSPATQRDKLKAMLEVWGADPHSAGRDDNERTWREVAAGEIIDRYQNPATGEYEGVPEEEALRAGALLSGVPKQTPEPTITDAFNFYLKENAKDTPEKRKKQEQRFRRVERSLIAVIGEDKRVSEITREEARKWRDMRSEAGAAPGTIKREKSDISTVINTARSELDAGDANPFEKLKLPKSKVSRREEREALPEEVIQGVYSSLEGGRNKVLLAIWTLIDFIGARPSEIRELNRNEVILDHAIPHLVLTEREGRSLKTAWSTRKVPLVGRALDVAKELLDEATDGSAPLFPHYCREGGMDNLSQALNRRIRKFSTNRKHVTYSLRHNMSDRLRRAEVHDATQRAIEGHSYGRGEAASYGGDIPLEKKRDALIKALGLD
ncbi:site-specific integrase [Pseudooceanicola sp. HF7]|uniref:site-specific integrase n=1 Tax=Pseudooceanicola sp. HF7 TaxID=2721560 RepID=UPI00142FEAC1|nr:site-specific integrase [Pseudooceanicola sp. HF7]NIZ09988.1 integrase [Pseudooceanicola sp. HF7]